jgi:hypothetical protein
MITLIAYNNLNSIGKFPLYLGRFYVGFIIHLNI